MAFAEQFDPQPFHIDEAAACASPYGGLIASGWHTVVLAMRMSVDELLGAGAQSLGSPGVDNLRWLRPVRPNDTLSLRLEVKEALALSSRTDRGIVTFAYSVRNQHGEEVMTMLGKGMFLRRPRDASMSQ